MFALSDILLLNGAVQYGFHHIGAAALKRLPAEPAVGQTLEDVPLEDATAGHDEVVARRQR